MFHEIYYSWFVLAHDRPDSELCLTAQKAVQGATERYQGTW